MIHNRKQNKKQEQGASLLEFAIAATVLLVARDDAGRILRFIAGNDMFFLNVAMAMAKATIAPAHGIAQSTVVTTMARNGTDFGIRVSGTGDDWFTGPAQMARGLLFAGFTESDANPDIGDSCITETVGLGGFAMAASPAVVGFLGAGSLADAIRYTRSMSEITVGPNPDGKGSRVVQVVPIESESQLRNRDWVEGNLRKVTAATQGRVALVLENAALVAFGPDPQRDPGDERDGEQREGTRP